MALNRWERNLEKSAWAYTFLVFLLVFVGSIFLDDQIVDLSLGAVEPSKSYLLGTDELGRDQLAKMAHGGKMSLVIAIVATLISLAIGLTYGVVSGYAGGILDFVMVKVLEVLYTLPGVIVLILCSVWFGSSLYVIVVTLGCVSWFNFARLVRREVISLKERDFVFAAKTMGVGPVKMFFRHFLPHLLPIMMVYGALMIPKMIIEESFLTFLGLGVQEPASSWGRLLSQGVTALDVYPWLALYPCLHFSIFLFSLNLIGFFMKKRFLEGK